MVATATLLTRDIQGESLSAATDRLVNSILFVEGVVDKGGNSFQVLQNLGTDMNIKVGSGTAFDKAVVAGDFAGQGKFVTEHQNATQVLAVAASDPTNDRIDNVILRVFDDTFDSSTDDFADIEVTTGTPSGSPSPPTVPSTAIVLAEILVQNAVTQIVNGDITDKRIEYKLNVRPAFAGWQLTLGTTDFIPSTSPDDLEWSAEEFDTDAFHSGSDAFVTIPAGLGGLYRIDVNLCFIRTGTSTGDWIVFAIKNTTDIKAFRKDATSEGAGNPNPNTGSISFFVDLQPTDTLKLEIQTFTDWSLQWDTGASGGVTGSWFSGQLLSPSV